MAMVVMEMGGNARSAFVPFVAVAEFLATAGTFVTTGPAAAGCNAASKLIVRFVWMTAFTKTLSNEIVLIETDGGFTFASMPETRTESHFKRSSPITPSSARKSLSHVSPWNLISG